MKNFRQTYKVRDQSEIRLPLLIMIPYSSRRKLILVLKFFSPPSPNITRTFPPELMYPLMEFNSDSVNLFFGPGKIKAFAFESDS